ncbi:PREDICTED: cyclic AMP-dependent transcription factor ATF-5, partial [Tinamus guttatus]|uniref:cyclic AMP-dependent transcription factor ATF-5 n=1 Tax=Tinamus guttatus TaxID=94827 RepID=UPI00052ED76D
PGFSDWMTEKVDFSSLLMEPGLGPVPAAPLSDLEAMASLLKRELEQLEDFFLDEPLLAPDQGDQCQSLEARNRELREKADSIEREIQYVKDLLIEVYKARSQRLRAS